MTATLATVLPQLSTDLQRRTARHLAEPAPLAHPPAERIERAKQVRRERDGRPGYEGFPSGPQRHGGAA